MAKLIINETSFEDGLKTLKAMWKAEDDAIPKYSSIHEHPAHNHIVSKGFSLQNKETNEYIHPKGFKLKLNSSLRKNHGPYSNIKITSSNGNSKEFNVEHNELGSAIDSVIKDKSHSADHILDYEFYHHSTKNGIRQYHANSGTSKVRVNPNGSWSFHTAKKDSTPPHKTGNDLTSLERLMKLRKQFYSVRRS